MANLQTIQAARLHNVACGVDKRIGHNTRARRTPHGWTLQYHSTDVVDFTEGTLPNGDHWRLIQVRTGGWRTSTTLQRIRHGLSEIGLELWTHDIKGEWRIVQRRKGCAWTMREATTKLRQVNGGDWVRI